MSTPGFISTHEQKKRPIWLWLIPIVLLVLMIVGIVVVTLNQANLIMRQEAKALEPFAINILPRFEPLRFNSLDGQTSLSGWFLKANQTSVRGTVVYVHDQGQNRLPYGLDTADLFHFFTDEGFQVIAFDLRASGNSGGDLASFGYMESDDVLAAAAVAKRLTPNGRVLLFGLGTGTGAVLSAYDALPSTTRPEAEIARPIEELELWRQDIFGILLDTPAGKTADYIRALISDETPFPLNVFLPWTLPFGVRLSAGNRPEINLYQLSAKVVCPMWITRNSPDPYLDNSLSDPLIEERLRIFPGTTRLYETFIEGHGSGYLLNRDAYLTDLREFLDQWYD